MILLTIVIPVHNRPELLVRLLDSLSRQVPDSVELLFVDNNCDEPTLELLHAFVKANAGNSPIAASNNIGGNIRIVSESKPGAAAARNRGLDSAVGEYVYFFDSDDELSVSAALKCVTVAKDNNADAVGIRTNIVREDGIVLKKPFARTANAKRQILANNFATQSLLLRTAFVRLHGRWNESLRYWNDWEWALRILLAKPKMVFARGTAHRIFLHPDSITGSGYGEHFSDIVRAIDAAKKDIAELCADESERRRLLFALDGRVALYAGHIYREGGRESASTILNTIPYSGLSALRRLKLRLVYKLTAAGIRGAWRLI